MADDYPKFTQIQLGVAGLIGSPIATAVLVSWNLLARGKAYAAVFFAISVVFIGASDWLVAQVSSAIADITSFIGLIVGLLFCDRVLGGKSELGERQSWGNVLVVVAGSLAFAVLYRVVGR